MYKDIVFDYAKQIREILDFRMVAEAYGMRFNDKGFAVCPFHNEKTASFGAQGKWGHCFGCGVNVDVIKLTRQLYGLSFFDALSKLNSDFNIGLPLDYKPTLREHREFDRRRREIEAKAKREEKLSKKWEEKYWLLLDTLICCYNIIDAHAPTTPDDPINPLYVKALNYKDYVSYLLDVLPTKKDYIEKGGENDG